MVSDIEKTLSIDENVFLLKSFKVFKLVENGVFFEEEVVQQQQQNSQHSNINHNDSNNNKLNNTGKLPSGNEVSKSHIEDEIVSRNLATNSLVLNNDSDKVISVDLNDYRFNGNMISLSKDNNNNSSKNNNNQSSELFDKVAACYNEVYCKGKQDSELATSSKIYEFFYNILVSLCDNYETCYYSRYFIKISQTLLQFKSDSELKRDAKWAEISTIFNENYKHSTTFLTNQNILSKANEKTINDNLLNIIDEDDLIIDNNNENILQNKHLTTKQLNNKGFFTTPTSPSWINNFLEQNDDDNGIMVNNSNNNNNNENNNHNNNNNNDDYLLGNNNLYGKKRDSFASYNSFGDSHNPPPPSIAGSSALGFPNANILMDSNAINEIESSLLNFQQQNVLKSPDKNDILAMAAAQVSNKNGQKSNQDSQAVTDEDEPSTSFNDNDFKNDKKKDESLFAKNNTDKKISKKKKNSRRFTSSASSLNLLNDKANMKNSIYQQQIENLKKIGNRSATLFKGQLAQPPQQNIQNNDQQNLHYDPLAKNSNNNSAFLQADAHLMKYDADVEQQIREQIMSNAALNSLYDDNTNFDRFTDLLANPDESYLNAQLKNNRHNFANSGSNNYHYEKYPKDNFEKLYTSPVQMRPQNGNNEFKMISTIPEDPSAPMMNYQSFTKNTNSNSNGSYLGTSNSSRTGRPCRRSNKFHFVTKKQLQKKTSKLPTASPVDLSKINENNIINNSNHSSVMSYLNHLNSIGNRYPNINTDYGIPQGLQAGGFPINSNYNNNNNNNLLMKQMEETIAEKNKKIADMTGQMEIMKDEISWLRKVVMQDVTSMKRTTSSLSNKQQMMMETDISATESQRTSPKEKTKEIKNITAYENTGENGQPGDKTCLQLTSSATPSDNNSNKEDSNEKNKVKKDEKEKTSGDDKCIKEEDKLASKEKTPSMNSRSKRFKFDFKIKRGNKLAA